MIIEATIIGGSIIIGSVFWKSISFAKFILDREDKNKPKEPEISDDPKIAALDEQIEIALDHLDSVSLDGSQSLINEAREAVDKLAAKKAAIIDEKQRLEDEKAAAADKLANEKAAFALKNMSKKIYPYIHPGWDKKPSCPLCGSFTNIEVKNGVYQVPKACTNQDCQVEKSKHLHAFCGSCGGYFFTSPPPP